MFSKYNPQTYVSKASILFLHKRGNGAFLRCNACRMCLDTYFDKIHYKVRLKHSLKYSPVFVDFPFTSLEVMIAG